MPIFSLNGSLEPLSFNILGVRYIRFTVTTAGTVTIRASNIDHDSSIHLFQRGTNTNELGNLVASNDNATGLDSEISLSLAVGTYVLAISDGGQPFTELEARQGANTDDDSAFAPIDFEVEIETGTATIGVPTHFSYGDADVGDNLSLTFLDSTTVNAVRGGTITFTVSGLDSDATAEWFITSSGGGTISGTAFGNGSFTVNLGDLEEGTLTATIAASDFEGFDATGAGDNVVLNYDNVILQDSNGASKGGFDTIQAAIDAAVDGDRVVLGRQSYDESVTVNKDVTILGANAGVNPGVPRGDESVITGAIVVTADGVTIDGIQLTGSALHPNAPPGFLSGIYLQGADNFDLRNSKLTGSDDAIAILSEQVTGLSIRANHIDGYALGAYVSGGGSTGTIRDNFFVGEDGSTQTGLAQGVFSESSQLAVRNNFFIDLYSAAILVTPSGPETVDLLTIYSGNSIINNGIDRPIQIQPSNLTHNILGTNFNEAFDGETAAANGVTGAFSFDGRGGDDRAWGGGEGDSLAGGSGNDALFGNGGDDSLNGGANNDLLFGGSGTDKAIFTGAVALASITAIDDADPDSPGDQAGWQVIAAGQGTDKLNDVEKVDDGAPGVILLVGHGGYATLQDALDAANDGDTILLAPGTYAETLTIDKAVTIAGPNVGIAGDGSRLAEAVINGGLVIVADGVTIDGLRITGSVSPDGAAFPAGINVQGDDFTLRNTRLEGPDSAAAILTGPVAGLDVGDNWFSGYAIGIYVSGGGSTGSIHDNLFQGDGGPFTGLGNGVNSESSGVLIQDNAFDGIYAGSLNLFPSGPDSVDLNNYVIGNSITNSGAARPVQIMPTDGTHNIVGTDFNEAFDGETAAANGVTGAFSFDGQGGDDRAWGGEQGDNLAGGTGDDMLFGNGGADLLDGGAGDDVMTGGAGDDWFVVRDLFDLVFEDNGGGSDRVFAYTSWALNAGSAVETLSAFNDAVSDPINLTGNELSQTIYGTAGNNILDGFGGVDALAGFGGDDWYVIRNSADRVFEDFGGGNDRVFAYASWTLGANAIVETLQAYNPGTTEAIDLTGNDFNQTIYGNAGANRIDGKSGTDTLFGDAGADLYAFTSVLSVDNIDSIFGFESGVDKIGFAGVSQEQLAAGAFRTGSSAQDADDRIIYDQATGALYYDGDGNGAGAQVQFATLIGAPPITASDFITI